MTSAINIRPATMEEIDAVCALWQRLEASKKQQPFGGDKEDEIPVRTRNLVAHSITSETAISLVAENNDQLIATLSAYIYEKPAVQLPTVAVLYSLWVDPEHRHKGIAQSLLATAEQSLKQMGAQSLQVAWDSGNLPAERFWQQAGFSPYEVIASKILK